MKKKLFNLIPQSKSGIKKLLLTMKLALIIVFLSVLQVSANVYSQITVNLDVKDKSIREVLKTIEQQSQVRFFYSDDLLAMNELIDIKADKKNIIGVLDDIFSKSPLTYKAYDNNLIVIAPRELLQQQKITGTVYDSSTGETMPGVNISVQGSTLGAITDANGKYIIEVPNASSILVFSFVGYVTGTAPIVGTSVVDIKLVPETKMLEEVVVVGYGIQKKSLVTGAISSVKSEDINKINISRPEEALQGRASGVQVVPQSGAPGAMMNVRIRGYSSNANSNPIYIVDGTKTGDINYLDPSDIAAIDVLKDAASAAIYGAEGGNGVVIITTKKGVSGATHITYDVQHSFKSVGKVPQLMNTKQYTEFMTDPNSTGATILPVGTIDQTINTNWLDAIFGKGSSTKHHLSFSGGTEKSNYLVALSYFKNEGVIVGDKDVFERYSIRFNSDHKIKKWLKIGNNLDYARFTTKGINENGGEFGGMIGSALQLDPTTPVEFTNGTPAWITNELSAYNTANGTNLSLLKAADGNDYGVSRYVAGEITNPLISRDLQTGVYTQDKLSGNVYAEITPIKGLTITTRLGLDFAMATNHFWNKTYYYDATNLNSTPIATGQWDQYYLWEWENFASYVRKFGDHNMTLLAGMSAEKYVHNNLYGRSVMLQDDPNFAYVEFSQHKNDNVIGYPRQTEKVSYFARGSYDFKGKYLLQASIRRDGTGLSQVPANGRWGIFPSFSAGWVLSEESFFPETVLSHVKLRGSWGQNGSLAALDENNQYGYSTTITGTIGGQPIIYPLSNSTMALGAEPTRLYNGGLTWEKAEQIDLGIDLRAFADKLSFTVDYYKKTTKGLIFTGIPSYTSGNYAPRFNGGTVENKGLEFDLGYRNQIGNLKYAVNVNLSTLKNEVTALNPLLGTRQGGANVGTGWNNATLFEPGHSIYHFYGYKTNGIDAATGEPIFVTQFGNDTSYLYIQDKDKQDIGSPIPKLIFGGNINLEYKGLDFTLTFTGEQGNKVLVGWLRSDKNKSNRPMVFYNDRWRQAGDQASMPGANWSANTYYSDLLVFDASFLRIQTIQLGYSIPSARLNQAKINAFRVYVSLDNFFKFTKYPGMDPQPTVANNATNNFGIDRGTYPIARDVMIGASISF
jgi:TonB-dependent starch-binding outer membrane protein SusC